jgi:hypothetical protein
MPHPTLPPMKFHFVSRTIPGIEKLAQHIVPEGYPGSVTQQDIRSSYDPRFFFTQKSDSLGVAVLRSICAFRSFE